MTLPGWQPPAQRLDPRDRYPISGKLTDVVLGARDIDLSGLPTNQHTWINEHQYDDLGEVRYSSGGLRFGDAPSGIMAPESDNGIAPDLTRSTQMLFFTNLLSRTEYGFITRNEERDVNPLLIRLLQDRVEAFRRLGVEVDAIESRTNI